MTREITGWHVLGGFVLAFGTIIAVNLTLAFNAVKTFPGLEVKNSYVASQKFDRDRAAQEALGWTVSASVENNILQLSVIENGYAVAPEVLSATFGRATHVGQDQSPQFLFTGRALEAPVTAGPGNWNLRVKLRAENGTLFQQRIPVRVSR